MALASLTADTISDAKPQKPLKVLGLCALLWALTFVIFFWSYFRQLAATDHFSHFPVSILLMGYLGYLSVRHGIALEPRFRSYGLVLAGFSFFVWGAACYFVSGLLGVIAAMISFLALIELLGGQSLRLALRPAIVFSLSLLTLPFGLDRTLIIGLQKVASRIASAWLDMQNIANMTTGVVIRTPGQDFLVEEACSGVNSLFAALTIAFFWVIYSRFTVIRSILFMSAIVFWVLLVNALRVWAIVYSQVHYGVELTSEPRHTLLGLGTFAGVMLLAASTDWAFRFVRPLPIGSGPIGSDTSRDASAENLAAQDVVTPRRALFAGAGLAVTMCVISAISFYRPTSAQAAPGTIANAALMPNIDAGTLPSQIAGWELKDARRLDRDAADAFGIVSQVWTYHNGNFPLIISIDGPYDSWHDLGYCYGSVGWQLRDSQNLELVTEAGQIPLTCVELNLYRGEGNRSLVLFTCVDSTGAVVSPPASHGTLWRNLTNRLGLSDAGRTVSGAAVQPPVFQIQMFAETDTEMTPDERASVDQLYDYTRRVLIPKLVATGN